MGGLLVRSNSQPLDWRTKGYVRAPASPTVSLGQHPSVSCYAETERAVIEPPNVELLLNEFRRLKRLLHHGSLSRTIWRVAVGPARQKEQSGVNQWEGVLFGFVFAHN